MWWLEVVLGWLSGTVPLVGRGPFAPANSEATEARAKRAVKEQ